MLLYELFVRLAIYIIHRGVVWQVNQTIASAARSYEDSMMMAGGEEEERGRAFYLRVLNQVSHGQELCGQHDDGRGRGGGQGQGLLPRVLNQVSLS